MKIVIYTHSLCRCGAERVAIQLAKGMKEIGHECVLVTDFIASEEYELPKGIERISLNARYIRSIVELRKMLKKLKPDIVLAMGTYLTRSAVPATIGLRTKLVVSERNDPSARKSEYPFRYLFELNAMRFAAGHVFQTKEAAEYYRSRIHCRGQVIYNPLDISRIPVAHTGVRNKTIVSVGRLEEQKNHELLIQAFSVIHREHPDYSLKIYGEGTQRKQLENLIAELGMRDTVELPGNTTDVLTKIKDAAMFVFPSNYEGLPNALIEAMALGLPCISTDCPCGGPKELIEDEYNGILVPVGDKEAMKNAMEKLICNPELADFIGEKAISIRRKLEMKAIVEQWENYFRQICIK